MSINPLNDISRVYLEQVAESHVPGKPAEKLGAVTAIPKAEQDAARERALAKAKAMREKKGIKEAAKPDYLDFDKDGNEKESMKKALRDKAKKKIEEAKKANDGNLANNYPPYDKVTRGDVIAGALGQDQMGGKKKKVTKEGYSNWREDLIEVVDKIKRDKGEDVKITEKQINNKIEINPKLNIGESIENFGGVLVEMVEHDEEFIYESANIAAEYFCEQGLNEFGVDILIEELGLDEFVNFVFDINNEVISEARSGGVKIEPVTAKGQKFKSGKPTGKSLERLRKLKAERKESEAKASESKPSGLKASLQRQSAVASAKKQQPKKKGVLDRVAGAVLKGMERHQKATASARQAFQKGMERHKDATATASHLAKETGKTVRKAGKLASHVASSTASGASKTTKVIKKAVVGEEIDLQEVSPPGMEGTVKAMKKHSEIDNPYALAWWMKKKGYKSHRKASGAMKEDASAPASKTQSQDLSSIKAVLTAKKSADVAQQKLAQAQKSAAQKGVNLSALSSSYEPEGEVIDERRKEDKVAGTPRKPRNKAFEIVAKSMGAGRMGVQPRGKKKEPGKKPPAAGEYGGPASPAQKVAKRRAAAQRAQDMMHSPRD